MGRKPNALILHYFHRGPKLEDASNRYQHTCKACGEQFPKGRIDSLQNHLTRKCAALSVADKTDILLKIHQVVPGPSQESKKETFTKTKERKQFSLPTLNTAPQQNFDGLNVLAEASRQVGQVERRTSQPYPSSSSNHEDSMGMAIDPALDASFSNAFLGAHSASFDELSALTHTNESSSSNIPPLPSYDPEHVEEDRPGSSNMSALPPPPPDAIMTSQPEHDLSTIAADATDLLPLPRAPETEILHTNEESATNTGNENGADGKAMEPWQINFDGPNFQAFYEAMQRAEPDRNVEEQRAANIGRAIAPEPITVPDEFVNEFSLDSHPPKAKNRQKFTVPRRKEVQDVRKKGACLRCRMLRKPCSSEDPCSACKSVNNARLWKEPCTRVRIPELFDLYTAGLYASLSYRNLNALKGQVKFEHYRGLLDATHFDDPSTAISFKGLQGRADVSSDIQIELSSTSSYPVLQDVKVIESDPEYMATKLGKYFRAVGRSLQEDEVNKFMRTTLRTVSEIYEESKSNGEDQLLSDVLELWTATRVLCDPALHWKISCYATPDDQQIISEPSDGLSYVLITSQLRASVEKRCAYLCKTVLTGFEKRLMQNKRGFGMFLTAVVMLNCVERTASLFHAWDNDNGWTFERQPHEYCKQAEDLSNIIHSVLKMRTVIPKTSPRPGTKIIMPIELGSSADERISKWYADVRVTPRMLNEFKEREFDAANSRSIDLKYVSKILLPQNCYF